MLINLVEQSSERTTLGKCIGHSEMQGKQYFLLDFLEKLLLYRFKKYVEELVTTVFLAFSFQVPRLGHHQT